MSTKNYANQYDMLKYYTEVIAPKYLGFDNADNYRIGIFGYINELFAMGTEDNANMMKTLFPEIFPNKAELPESIMAYASLAKFTDINATPSKMKFLLGVHAKDLHSNAVYNTDGIGNFVIYKNLTNIKVEDRIGFMIPHDIKISFKQTSESGKYVYSAIYDKGNSIDNISNPYIKVLQYNDKYGEPMVFFETICSQMEMSNNYINITSEQTLENIYKIVEFDGNLADFNVYYKGPSDKDYRYINKLLEGEYEIDGEFCFYSYLDTNKFELRFIAKTGYFVPEFNGSLKIEILTTEGASGSFIYTDQKLVVNQETGGDYEPVLIEAIAVGNSDGGIDKQEMNVLRKKVSELFSVRGVIVMDSDLQNYFNSFQDNNYIYFSKLRDDAFYRIFSAYMLMKDDVQNIIPTNTVTMDINSKDLVLSSEGRANIKTLTAFKFKNDNKGGTVIYNGTDEEKLAYENDNYLYANPFLIALTENPTMVNLYVNHIKRYNYLEFEYINSNTLLQMITSQLEFKRDIFQPDNKYTITVKLKKNIEDKSYAIIDSDGVETGYLKTKGILYDKDNKAIGWFDMSYKYYDEDTDEYVYYADILVEDNISNKLTIPTNNSLHLPNTNTISDIAIPIENVKCKIVTYVKESGNSPDGIGDVIPIDSEYISTNIFSTTNDSDIDFMINMTDIIRPKFSLYQDGDDKMYKIESMPVIRHSYINNADRLFKMIKTFREKKLYLLDAATMIQNAFTIDMKLYNTYGPASFYNIGLNYEKLDRLDLSIEFKLKLVVGTDYSIVDTIREFIRTYIENLNNDATANNLYIDNLISEIKAKYSEVQHIQFTSLNDKDSSYQSIETTFDKDNVSPGYIPEYLNIRTTYDLTTDSYITGIKLSII